MEKPISFDELVTELHKLAELATLNVEDNHPGQMREDMKYIAAMLREVVRRMRRHPKQLGLPE